MNFRVHAGGSSTPCIYYINNSTFTPGTPDVQLRGGSNDGTVVAFAKFHNLSRHVTLGLGSPDDKTSPTIFEEMKKESRLIHSEYIFETDMGSRVDGKRNKYVWKRTVGKKSFANYACLDAATGQLIACFEETGAKSSTKVGRLCVTAQTSEKFDELLLVSWMSILEQENRNVWHAGRIISATASH